MFDDCNGYNNVKTNCNADIKRPLPIQQICKDKKLLEIFDGKSCDVLDSNNNKGTWYCRKDKCHVMLGNHTDFFDISDITEKYKCKKDTAK